MDRKGFTLIEMMIVVAIIAVLVSIALPNMLGARKTANEKSAMAELRTLGTSLETYYVREGEYTDDLSHLVDNNLLPDRYDGIGQGDSVKLKGKGYTLSIDTLSSSAYNITAEPDNARFGGKCYRVTSGGTLWQTNFESGSCDNSGWQTI